MVISTRPPKVRLLAGDLGTAQRTERCRCNFLSWRIERSRRSTRGSRDVQPKWTRMAHNVSDSEAMGKGTNSRHVWECLKIGIGFICPSGFKGNHKRGTNSKHTQMVKQSFLFGFPETSQSMSQKGTKSKHDRPKWSHEVSRELRQLYPCPVCRRWLQVRASDDLGIEFGNRRPPSPQVSGRRFWKTIAAVNSLGCFFSGPSRK